MTTTTEVTDSDRELAKRLGFHEQIDYAAKRIAEAMAPSRAAQAEAEARCKELEFENARLERVAERDRSVWQKQSALVIELREQRNELESENNELRRDDKQQQIFELQEEYSALEEERNLLNMRAQKAEATRDDYRKALEDIEYIGHGPSAQIANAALSRHASGEGLSEREAQRQSFAYGNVAIDNPSITREDIANAAKGMEQPEAGKINEKPGYTMTAVPLDELQPDAPALSEAEGGMGAEGEGGKARNIANNEKQQCDNCKCKLPNGEYVYQYDDIVMCCECATNSIGAGMEESKSFANRLMQQSFEKHRAEMRQQRDDEAAASIAPYKSELSRVSAIAAEMTAECMKATAENERLRKVMADGIRYIDAGAGGARVDAGAIRNTLEQALRSPAPTQGGEG